MRKYFWPLFIKIFLVFIVAIVIWQKNERKEDKYQQIKERLQAVEDSLRQQREGYFEYYFLKRINLPDSLYFADSLIVLDRVSKARLFERVVYLSRRELLLIMNKRMQEWRPLIEPVLTAKKFHPDFFYMAIAESFLDPAAVSSAQAKGMWQFRRATARRYGLKVNWWIDERFDPVLSTEAAIRYLRYLGDKYNNNWPLVAAAYNMGESGLDRYIKRNGHDKYFGMRLPAETSVYFFNILAIKFIVEQTNWLEYFSASGSHLVFTECYEVEVLLPQVTALRDVVSGFGNYYLFKLLNGKYRRSVLPAGENTIRVPSYLFDDFLSFVQKKGWQYSILPS